MTAMRRPRAVPNGQFPALGGVAPVRTGKFIFKNKNTK